MSDLSVSVIIAAYNSHKTIGKCLESLQHQQDTDNYEVIVVDSSQDSATENITRNYPKVKLVRVHERKYPGDARNLGIAQAKGDIFAFTDTDCIPDKNWVARIIEAHQHPHPVIGGVVDIANKESYVSWAAYFCEFNQWIPREAENKNKITEIPTCCLSMKRWVFDKFGPFIEGTYCSDTAFHWKMAKEGHRPMLVPTIKISHINIDRWVKYFQKQFMHGRQFARVRVAEKGFSVPRRLLYLLLSPLLPLLLTYRIFVRLTDSAYYFKKFLLVSPIVLTGLSFWSFGEMVGYLLGASPYAKDRKSL